MTTCDYLIAYCLGLTLHSVMNYLSLRQLRIDVNYLDDSLHLIRQQNHHHEYEYRAHIATPGDGVTPSSN